MIIILQMTSKTKKVEMSIIAGSLEGLRACLINFTQSADEGDYDCNPRLLIFYQKIYFYVGSHAQSDHGLFLIITPFLKWGLYFNPLVILLL